MLIKKYLSRLSEKMHLNPFIMVSFRLFSIEGTNEVLLITKDCIQRNPLKYIAERKAPKKEKRLNS